MLTPKRANQATARRGRRRRSPCAHRQVSQRKQGARHRRRRHAVLPADAVTAVDRARAAASDGVTDSTDTAEFFCVEVKKLARSLAPIANHGRRRLERLQAIEAQPPQDTGAAFNQGFRREPWRGKWPVADSAAARDMLETPPLGQGDCELRPSPRKPATFPSRCAIPASRACPSLAARITSSLVVSTTRRGSFCNR
jgi:hypothetical protein